MIRLKEENEEGMDEKCSAAVEHWQILSLEDWKFSFKFKNACKDDIKQLCEHPKVKNNFCLLNGVKVYLLSSMTLFTAVGLV